MIVLVQANVLTVGLNGENEVLRELPIRLLAMQSASEAVRSLKNEKVYATLLRKANTELRAVKPDIPTIVFVRAGDRAQEIDARSLGVSAVLTDQASDELFRQTVANVLGLKNLVSIKAISPARSKKRRYHKVRK